MMPVFFVAVEKTLQNTRANTFVANARKKYRKKPAVKLQASSFFYPDFE